MKLPAKVNLKIMQHIFILIIINMITTMGTISSIVIILNSNYVVILSLTLYLSYSTWSLPQEAHGTPHGKRILYAVNTG